MAPISNDYTTKYYYDHEVMAVNTWYKTYTKANGEIKEKMLAETWCLRYDPRAILQISMGLTPKVITEDIIRQTRIRTVQQHVHRLPAPIGNGEYEPDQPAGEEEEEIFTDDRIKQEVKYTRTQEDMLPNITYFSNEWCRLIRNNPKIIFTHHRNDDLVALNNKRLQLREQLELESIIKQTQPAPQQNQQQGQPKGKGKKQNKKGNNKEDTTSRSMESLFLIKVRNI